MSDIWRWGADLIIAIQTVHNPVLDALFNAITSLGSEGFYLLLLPLLYWCVDKDTGQRLTFLFLLTIYGNAALKEVWGHPRPFEYDLRVLKLDKVPAEELGYGLPSGHSQSAITVWGYLGAQVRRRWMWVLAAVSVILVAFSRIYLGVHFPSDVLAGLLLGAAWVGIFFGLESFLPRWLVQQPLLVQVVMAVVIPILLLITHSSKDASAAVGALIGVGVGMGVESRSMCFSTDGPLWQRVARFAVGILAIVVFREGLKLVFPGEGESLYVLFRVACYLLVGLWVTLLGPWVFQGLRLMNVKAVKH